MSPRFSAACVSGALCVLVLGLGGCGRDGWNGAKDVSAQVAPPPLVEIGPAVTEEEARAFADKFENAIAAGDQGAANGLIDWDAVITTSLAGLDAPKDNLAAFAKGMKIGVHQQGSLVGKIIGLAKDGGSYQLLHLRTRGKRRTALFRLIQANEGGMNYHEYILARRPDGQVRAVDAYIYLSGELLTETFRREAIKATAQSSQGFLDRLVGADKEYAKNLGKTQGVFKLFNEGKPREALDAYRALPPEAQKEKLVLLIRIQAAMAVNDEEYAAAIEDFRKYHPNDACVDLLAIDGEIMKKHYPEALASVDRLDKSVGGDPHLDLTRAGIQIEAQDYDAARALARKLIEAEPDDPNGHWTLVNISLKTRKYADTLPELRILRDKYHLVFQDMSTVPEYAGFVKSPDYQKWLKEQAPKKPVTKKEAPKQEEAP